MDLIVEKLFAYVQIALEVPREEGSKSLPNHRQAKPWGPEHFIQATARSIINHADVIQTFISTEELRPPCYLARQNIPSLSDLYHLLSHKLMLHWVPMRPLWFQERLEWARGVVRLSIAYEPLIAYPQFQKKGADPSSHSNQDALALRRIASHPAVMVARPSAEDRRNFHWAL